jgi:O26-antigen biosynthesis N-acetyl-L-fucosamine transferase
MRILIVVVYYPPSTTSAAQMMRDLAEEFVRQGHQVRVATPDEAVKGATTITVEGGVEVVRVRAAEMKSANKVVRLWRESRLSARTWKYTRDLFVANPCDLIVYYSPTIFWGGLVRRLKSLWKCPAYLVHRDIFPQWAVDTGIIRKGSLLHRYLRRIELEQYAAADIIGVEAPGNLRYFDNRAQGVGFNTEVCYNWTAPMSVTRPAVSWRRRLGLDGKTVFFYGGNIGLAQDLGNIVDLATRLRHRDDIRFLLIGEGTEVPRIKNEIARRELTNMLLLPPIPQRDYLACLSEFDIGLVSLNRHMKSNNFPGKFLGYVSCGKPILASINPGNDLLEVLCRSGAGIGCVNGDDAALLDAALTLADQPELRVRMGDNARALAENTFSVRAIATQLLSHFSGTPVAGELPETAAVSGAAL